MAGKWMQGLSLKKGALRAEAKREGAITKQGKIRISWLRRKAKQKGKIGKRARLALVFRKSKH